VAKQKYFTIGKDKTVFDARELGQAIADSLRTKQINRMYELANVLVEEINNFIAELRFNTAHRGVGTSLAAYLKNDPFTGYRAEAKETIKNGVPNTIVVRVVSPYGKNFNLFNLLDEGTENRIVRPTANGKPVRFPRPSTIPGTRPNSLQVSQRSVDKTRWVTMKTGRTLNGIRARKWLKLLQDRAYAKFKRRFTSEVSPVYLPRSTMPEARMPAPELDAFFEESKSYPRDTLLIKYKLDSDSFLKVKLVKR